MAGEVERLQELVDKYDNIVFFGGAEGIDGCPGSRRRLKNGLIFRGFYARLKARESGRYSTGGLTPKIRNKCRTNGPEGWQATIKSEMVQDEWA